MVKNFSKSRHFPFNVKNYVHMRCVFDYVVRQQKYGKTEETNGERRGQVDGNIILGSGKTDKQA